jgi:hypothetical protein
VIGGKQLENIDLMKKELHALLAAKNAHLPLLKIVENFPKRYYNSKFSAVAYSPWQLLEHIRIAQWDILEFIRNPDHISPDWPEGYWPPANESADKEKWEKTVQAIFDDLMTLDSMIDDPKVDIFAPLPHASKYSIFREILLVADHNAYHLGQFMVLRRFLKT